MRVRDFAALLFPVFGVWIVMAFVASRLPDDPTAAARDRAVLDLMLGKDRR